MKQAGAAMNTRSQTSWLVTALSGQLHHAAKVGSNEALLIFMFLVTPSLSSPSVLKQQDPAVAAQAITLLGLAWYFQGVVALRLPLTSGAVAYPAKASELTRGLFTVTRPLSRCVVDVHTLARADMWKLCAPNIRPPVQQYRVPCGL